MKNKLFYIGILFFLIFISFEVFSQSLKGKISGKIIDAETKQPLPFINVILQGTRLGGNSDENGNYFILNIPPGEYVLISSMIGYSKVVTENVIVNVDRTTTINVFMKPSTVTTKTVTVIAERPAIIKDLTSSFSSLESKQIERAPVEGLRGVLEFNAGIQQGASGNFSVRGSGSYEINFQINGVEQTTTNTGIPGQSALSEKSNNSWKYDFNPLGVQQLEVISGGFSAEYGNAQAGVVKVVTKEGGLKLNGEIRFEYRPPGLYHYGPYLYGNDTYEWKKWTDMNYWISALPGATMDSIMKYYYQPWVMNHSPSADNKLGVYDYRKIAYTRYMFGIGGPLGKEPEKLKFFISGEIRSNPTRVPTIEKTQDYQNITLTTTYYPVGQHKLKFMGMYQFSHGGLYSGSDDIRWAGGSANRKYVLMQYPTKDEIVLTQSLIWTYSIGSHTFLETALNHQNEKIICPYRYAISEGDPWLVRDGPWRENQYYVQPFSFTTVFNQDSYSDIWSFTSDYTNQLTQFNQIKFGVKANVWNLQYNGITGKYEASAFVTASGYAEYYKSTPYSLSAYFQDKMEYEGMIANLGVRFDAFNMNTPYPYDRFDPFYQALGSGIGDPRTIMPDFKYSILPRIGISFPIGPETAFRLQYGHFSSMPMFNQALSKRAISGWDNYGNPNLKPKKTINYEFGVQQSLNNTHRLDVALYYNDRVDQISNLYIYAPNTGSQQSQKKYLSFDNNGYGSTKGIEITLEKFSQGNWNYRISYSISQTKYGNFGSNLLYSDDPNDPRNYQQRNFAGDFLSYDDRTHNLRTMIQYSTNENEGIEFFGFYPLSRLNIGLTYSAQSGIPFTYVTSFDQFQDVVNNRRFPLESKFDLTFSKRLRLFDQIFSLGIRIMNLFDNKWLTPMGGSSDPDTKNWVEKGITKDNPADDPLRKSYVLDYYTTYRNVPRQIFFTLGVGF